MTRENKLAIVIGFGLLLFVGILVSDHLSARNAQIASPQTTAVRFEQPSRLPGGDPEPFGVVPPPALPGQPVDGQFRISDATIPGGFVSDQFGGAGAQVPVVPEAAKERTHVIAKGETLGDVAKRYYGKRSLGQKLEEFNKVDSSRLKIGQSIKIPDIAVLDPTAAPAPAPERALVGTDPGLGIAPQPQPEPAPATQRPKYGTVKVAEGDTLYRIAKRVYGDGARWSEIAAMNNLGEGKALKPGRELKYALAQ